MAAFEGLTCTHCCAQMHWNGTDKIIKCEFCGTEYTMHPKEAPDSRNTVGRTISGESAAQKSRSDNDGKRIVDVGRGRIDYVIIKDEKSSGPHFSLFIPKGWHVKIDLLVNAKRINVMSPAPVSVVLEAPEGDALISINSDYAYQHMKESYMNQHMQFQSNISDYRVHASYMNAARYLEFLMSCDQNIQRYELLSSASQPASQPDAAFAKRQKEIMVRYHKTFRYADTNWARNSYRVLNVNGNEYFRTMEVIVNRVSNGPLDEDTSPGFGQWFLQNLTRMQNPILWETHRQVVLTASRERYSEALEYYKQVRDTFNETPQYRAFEQFLQKFIMQSMAQTQQHIANVQAQMAQDNLNHINRCSDIIRGTNEYTTNVMHQMQSDTSASMDRVRNLQSESIRGVNTYYTNDGRVGEASINWDHVYQSNVNPDSFLFTRDTTFEPGVDFDELNRTNGDY